MSSEERPVSVRIMDMEYRVACPPEDEHFLRDAADRLNATMKDIRDTGKVLGTERIAVMAALNISYELLSVQRRMDDLEQGTQARVQALLEQVEQTLATFVPAPESE